MIPYGYGGYGYGTSGYYSPVPQTFWGSIGSSLGSIGQAAQQWLPMAQMMEQGARQNFDYYMNMPGLSDDQRQQAAQGYVNATRHLPAFLKLNLIQQSVPGPVTTPGQAAVPGAPAVAQGQATPASGSSGALRERVSSDAQAAQPAVSEVRGPSRTQYLLPPQSIQNQSVLQVLGENSPVWQNMPAAMKAQIGAMRWSDALQVYPNLAQAAQAQVSPFEMDQMVSTLGSSSPIYQIVQRAGFDPSRITISQAQQLPGVDVAIARQVEFGNIPGIGGNQQGQPGQTGTTQPGTTSGYSPNQYGYWLPGLANSNAKGAKEFAQQVIPNEMWDYKNGRPDMPAIEAQGRPYIQAPLTAHDQTIEANARYNQVRQLVAPLITRMENIVGPNKYWNQGDAQNALKGANTIYAQIQKLVKQQVQEGQITKDQGDEILAGIPQPTMPTLMRPQRPVRPPKGPAPGTVPGNVRLNLENIAQAIRDSDPKSPERKALIQRYNTVGSPYGATWDAASDIAYHAPTSYPPQSAPPVDFKAYYKIHGTKKFYAPDGTAWSTDGINGWSFWNGKAWVAAPTGEHPAGSP